MEGQESAKFIGGLARALLFRRGRGRRGGLPRRPLAGVARFGLAFGALGITFNLALHPSTRPVWSADILQGMALSGLVVAAWRSGDLAAAPGRSLRGSRPGVVVVASSRIARAFPGVAIPVRDSERSASPFPVVPWLALAAIGAWPGHVSRPVGRLAVAVRPWASWPDGSQGILRPPIKFPLNPIYALAGGSAGGGHIRPG